MPLRMPLPKKGAKIVVAMSGGVDSSTTAAWLKKQGYKVIGISLHLHNFAPTIENSFGRCCSLSDINDAKNVATHFKIPFYVTHVEAQFREAVIDDFVQEYLQGRTPNPCVRCNEKVKFSFLLNWAKDLGADYLATGHYSRIQYNPQEERFELLKAIDQEKDQSYFLFPLKKEDLPFILFPLGELEKKQVRKLAKELGLKVANKPDSQEICFIQNRNYRQFIEQNVAKDLLKSGLIKDKEGNILGEHKGTYQFTIGQKKGLNLKTNKPYYVIAIDYEKAEVIVGEEKELFQTRFVAKNLNWILPPQLHKRPLYEAKIRYRAKAEKAYLTLLPDNRVKVEFLSPQRAITPGQAVVFYKGEKVIGGGWIETPL